MTDPQGSPSRAEREAVADRVRRLADRGRINTADRDIRLTNVENAQSGSELELMSRDLDQLEAALPDAPHDGPEDAPQGASPGSAAPYSEFHPEGLPTVEGPSVEVRGSRRGLAVIGAVVGLVVVLGLVAGVAAVVSGGDSSSSSSGSSTLPPAQTGGSGGSGKGGGSSPSREPQNGDVAGGYTLSRRGVSAFVAGYRAKFGTYRAVDMVLYKDYAVANVPIAGGRGRERSWLYRNDSGWTSASGVHAVLPGSVPIDTRRLNVPALMRNEALARRTLKVEKPTQTYVILRFQRQVDKQPLVSVYVSNGFGESGYLTTRLDGHVLHAYPYGG